MSKELTIAELILRYLNKETLSARESERIKLWLSDEENLKRMEGQFRDPVWLMENLKVVGGVDEIDHWRKFLALMKERGEYFVNTESGEERNEKGYNDEETNDEEQNNKIHTRMRRLRIWKVAAAAAILIAIIGGGYWITHHSTAPAAPTIADQNQKMQDLAPGGNKAVLTLGNGSTIILDSAGNGNLAEQGLTKVVKLAAGQLSYRADESNGKPAASATVLYNTITTPAGGQYQVELPDGSKAWLNAGSSLRFPTAFIGTRKVTVTGEAYFEVTKDAANPFLVESGDKTIAVLGTSFNVNAYADEPFFAVSLVNGSVRVREGASQEILKPGQQAQVSKGGMRVNDHVNLRQVTAWKDGLFKFYNSDIQTIMREIGRWYNVTIEYEGKIPDDRFTGTMDKSLNASDVLKILALSKVHFRIEGQKIVVMPD